MRLERAPFARCRRLLKRGGIYLTTVLTPVILIQMLWTSKFGSKRAAIAFTGLRSAREKKRDLLVIKELMEAGRSARSLIDGTRWNRPPTRTATSRPATRRGASS